MVILLKSSFYYFHSRSIFSNRPTNNSNADEETWLGRTDNCSAHFRDTGSWAGLENLYSCLIILKIYLQASELVQQSVLFAYSVGLFAGVYYYTALTAPKTLKMEEFELYKAEQQKVHLFIIIFVTIFH